MQLLCNMMIVEFSGSQLVELQSLTGKSLYDAKYDMAKSVTSWCPCMQMVVSSLLGICQSY